MGYVYRRKDGKVLGLAYPDVSGRLVRESAHTSKMDLAKKLLKKRERDAWQDSFLGHTRKITYEELARKAFEYLKAIGRNMRFFELKNRVLERRFKGKLISEITRQEVISYQIERAKTVKGNTVNRELAVLRRFFNIGKKLGLVRDNPVAGIEFFKVPPTAGHILTPIEIRRLSKSAPAHIQPMIVFALHTGFRISNVLGLQWKAINFDSKTVTLDRTKGGRIEKHQMHPIVRDLLWKMHTGQSPESFVFGKADGTPRKSIRTAWDVACTRANIEGLVFHDLRRTFATTISRGTDLFTVQALLGHRDISTTQIYVQPSEQRKMDAVNKLLDLYQGNDPSR